MTTRIGVVLFPGTNSEHDVVAAVQQLGGTAEILWHGDNSLNNVDVVVLPGGFTHGDYLRPGAIASKAPVMEAVSRHAQAGGTVVGIGNGFQILTEAGLLPGAFQKNTHLRFICRPTTVKVETTDSAITSSLAVGDELVLPINHHAGNYTCPPETLSELQDADRVLLRYLDNPNGSIDNIAAICSPERNVIGLMPRPERATSELLGSVDGQPLLRSLL